MARPLSDLPIVLSGLNKRIDKNTSIAVQRAASSIHRRVVPDTPVDTGGAGS